MGTEFTRPIILNDYAQERIRAKARRLAKRPELTGEDKEDIEQQLTLHLIGQAHHFDAERASLNTFIARVIDSAVAMLLRAKHAAKRAAERDVRSLESAVPDDVGAGTKGRTVVSPLDEVELAERRARLCKAVNELPGRLRRDWERLLAGTPASAARDLGISPRQLRHRMQEIRMHFEQHGLDGF